jgi:uncharacterized protein YjiK
MKTSRKPDGYHWHGGLKAIALLATCVIAAALSGCGGASDASEPIGVTPVPTTPPPPPPPPPTADTTPPAVSVVSPASGSTVASPVTIMASASDSSGIAVVRFFADGALIDEVTEAPYETVWVADAGSYAIRVEAVDGSAAANASSVNTTYTIADGNTVIPPPGQWQAGDFSTVLDVGPGTAHPEINDLPWESVGPDTLIRIRWRNEPYQAKWVINAAGTSSSPIVITGVPDAGRLPIISGESAFTRTQLSYPNQERSIIKIGGASRPSGSAASWVFVENLHIRGANPGNTFQDTSGQTRSYASNAASIHVQIGSNIFIRNNILSDSGNGLFSGFQSEELVISGNRFEGNGNTGSASHHNAYTESVGIIYEYNHFLPLRAGANGNNLKDRSAGTVIRYNWIESGSRQLDLVDSDHANVYGSPMYDETFVYGNVLIEPANSVNRNVVHYGGDLSGRESTYRKGVLHFYNNTVISHRTDGVVLFGMSSNEEAADARNNVVYSSHSGNTIAITSGRGIIDLRGNWLQSGWSASSGSLTGSVNDLGNVSGPSPDFADEAQENYRLTASSSAVDAGVTLSSAAATLPVDREYVEHGEFTARPSVGSIDAGAFEFTGQVVVPSPTIETTTLPNAVAGTSYSASLSAVGGTPTYTWSIENGQLPAGLSLNPDSGEISGTPQAVETQSFDAVVLDSNQQSDRQVLSLSVVADNPPPTGSSLDGYDAVTSLRSLSFVDSDLSGIEYVVDTNTFFLIQNNGGKIWEVDADFNRIRTITMSGFGDVEDIAYLGNNEFAIVDESSQLLIGTISAVTTRVSAGDFQRLLFDNYSGNSGYEGVAYDSILQTFYVVKESSPKRIRSFLRPTSSDDMPVTTSTPFDADQLPAGDLSSVRLDDRTGRLLILSHESHKLMDVGLDGFVHGELRMADSSQHEGVALDSSYNIYVTSEPRNYRVYAQ